MVDDLAGRTRDQDGYENQPASPAGRTRRREGDEHDGPRSYGGRPDDERALPCNECPRREKEHRDDQRNGQDIFGGQAGERGDANSDSERDRSRRTACDHDRDQ